LAIEFKPSVYNIPRRKILWVDSSHRIAYCNIAWRFPGSPECEGQCIMSMYIIGAIVVIIATAGWSFWNDRRFERRQKRRKVELDAFLASLPKLLDAPEFLAVGNQGAVYAGRLGAEWRDELTDIWESSALSNVSDRVVLKIVDTRGGVGKRSAAERLRVVTRLAQCIEDARGNDSRVDKLCPFLALGRPGRGPGAEHCFVEIMPFIEGPMLKNILCEKKLEVREASGRLIEMLETVEFFEQVGYYTRNLDAENVMVGPDGQWTRIDFDSGDWRKDFPLRRMVRLIRLALEVFDRAMTAQDKKAHADSIALLRGAIASPESASIVTTPRNLINIVKRCV
jgi:hypothetical protein